MPSLITDLIWILLGGLVGGMIAKALKQPLIIGYIIAGVIVGPNTPGITVVSEGMIADLAEIGVALLLFSLGIEFSLRELKPIGRIAGFGAIIQVAITLAFGFALGHGLGWNNLSSFCLGISIVSSSTAVILKSLVASGHVGALSGRVMLGMSIVQDLTVIPLMIVLMSLHDSGGGSFWETAKPVGLALVFVGIMAIVGSRVIPKLLKFVAHWQSQELFLFTVIAISLGIGGVSFAFGLSLAFGAFVAGLVLAGSDYGNKALSELIPLRDLFALVFFVSVGMMLQPVFIWQNIGEISLLVAVACIGRGIILGGLCWSFGYRNVIPLAALLGMMPISEIGFIVIQQASVGSSKGPVIDDYVYSMILNMIVLSMVIGPFVAGFTAPLYGMVGKIFRRAVPQVKIDVQTLQQHVIIAGGGFLGRYIAHVMKFLKLPYVVIEPNHRMFVQMQSEKLNILFGDPTQRTILAAAHIDKARLLLITTDAYADIVGMTHAVKEIVPDLRIVVQYEGHDNLQSLRELGIDEVVQPEYEVGLEMLRQALNSQQVSTQETEHYLDEVRQMLYTPLESTRGDKRHLRRLRRTMGLLELEWVVVPRNSQWIGRSIMEIGDEVNVVGVTRAGTFTPNPLVADTLQAGDGLAVVGTIDKIDSIEQQFRVTQ